MKTRLEQRHAMMIILGAMLLSACTSWRVQQVAPAVLLNEIQPAKVRVERADGARLVLTWPMLVGDSIRAPQGTMALSDISAIALRKFDPLKTTGLVGGILGGAAFLAALSTEAVISWLDRRR